MCSSDHPVDPMRATGYRRAPWSGCRGASRSRLFFVFRSALPIFTFEGVDRNDDGNNNDITVKAYQDDGLGKAPEEIGDCAHINCSRGAPLTQLNVRVSKSFRVIGNARLEAIGEVFMSQRAQPRVRADQPAPCRRGNSVLPSCSRSRWPGLRQPSNASARWGSGLRSEPSQSVRSGPFPVPRPRDNTRMPPGSRLRRCGSSACHSATTIATGSVLAVRIRPRRPGAPMIAVIEQLAVDFSRFAPEILASARTSLYRVYRDTRFSSDKTPLKTHISASFRWRGLPKGGGAGLYLEVDRWTWMGGGFYSPEPQHLCGSAATSQKPTPRSIGSCAAQGSGGVGALDGDRLTRLPRGHAADDPAAEYLNTNTSLRAASSRPRLRQPLSSTPRFSKRSGR